MDLQLGEQNILLFGFALTTLLIKLCAQIIGGSVCYRAAIITYEVVARYVFTAPTIWSEDISLLAKFGRLC